MTYVTRVTGRRGGWVLQVFPPKYAIGLVGLAVCDGGDGGWAAPRASSRRLSQQPIRHLDLNLLR